MYRSVVLVIASVASFLGSLDMSAVNVAIPTISKEFNASFTEAILIPTVYLVALAVLQPVFGQLGDRRGMKDLFVYGLVLFVAGSFLSGLSEGVSQILVFRIIQGAGAAATFALSIALIVNVYPRAEHGRAIGINLATIYTGMALGPPIGGFLVQLLGWRSIFYVNVPIGIVMTVLSIAYMREEKVTGHPGRFDYAGAATLGLFLSLALLLLSGLTAGVVETALLSVTCLAAFAGFVLLERRNANPLVDLKLFTQNRVFAAGNATALLNYAPSAAAIFLVSIYLQLIIGYTPEQAGLILLVQPVMMAIVAFSAGALTNRFGARLLSSVGMAVRVAAFLLLASLGRESSELSIVGALMLLGTGHALFSSPNTSSVMSSVSPEQVGVASGAMGTVRSASQSIGVAILGGIVALSMPAGAFAALSAGTAVATGNTASLFVAGMDSAFLLGAALSAVGIITSLVRGKGGEIG